MEDLDYLEEFVTYIKCLNARLRIECDVEVSKITIDNSRTDGEIQLTVNKVLYAQDKEFYNNDKNLINGISKRVDKKDNNNKGRS
jgi:hypothetical protein